MPATFMTQAGIQNIKFTANGCKQTRYTGDHPRWELSGEQFDMIANMEKIHTATVTATLGRIDVLIDNSQQRLLLPITVQGSGRISAGTGQRSPSDVERASPYEPSVCAAVVTHPCANAKWFVHDRDTGLRGHHHFKTRKLAMYAAIRKQQKIRKAYKEHFIKKNSF